MSEVGPAAAVQVAKDRAALQVVLGLLLHQRPQRFEERMPRSHPLAVGILGQKSLVEDDARVVAPQTLRKRSVSTCSTMRSWITSRLRLRVQRSCSIRSNWLAGKMSPITVEDLARSSGVQVGLGLADALEGGCWC